MIENKLPIQAAVRSKSEPFHWHDEMELICVIRGIIEVKVNNKFYLLKEDEIILINDEDMHRIHVEDDASAFISIHLDLKFIEETMPDIASVWFLCNPTVNTPEKEPVLCRLRSRLAQILLEMKDSSTIDSSRLFMHITSILNVLMNHFNLTGRDPESYQNTEQFERIWSIIDYIYNNSEKRISLKDVSNHVHLSDSYLSHCIKDNTGMGFEDLLNYFRAEESIKMLLTSNASITRISYDCGFSDIKYYNKYFERFFGCTPQEYRKRNKLEGEDVSLSIPASETIVYDDLLMNKLRRYISQEKPDKVSFEDVVTLEVDLKKPVSACRPFKHFWTEYVDAGDKAALLDEDTQWLLYDVQDDIGFTYIRVHHAIGEEWLSGKQDFSTFPWEETFEIIDFIKEIYAYPMLVLPMDCSSNSLYIFMESTPGLGAFVKKCTERYGEEYVQHWRFVSNKDCIGDYDTARHLLFDTAFMAPYFINHIVNPTIENLAKSFTRLYDGKEGGIFSGGFGLLTTNGLKKPLYHAYHFLSCMGDMVLCEGDHYIITRKDDNIQILIYNLPEHVRNHPLNEIAVESHNRYADFAQDDLVHFNIHIHHLTDGEYIIKQYKLDRETGSIFDKLMQHEVAEYLSERDTTLLNSSCYPSLKVSMASKCQNWSIQSSVAPNSVEFITLKMIKKNQL